MPKVVMNSTDASKKHQNRQGGRHGRRERSLLFDCCGSGCGKTKGLVGMWMWANGTDVDNSNTERFIGHAT
jgi:hypothetical protein